jgi:hypothetical protein
MLAEGVTGICWTDDERFWLLAFVSRSLLVVLCSARSVELA